MMVDENVIIQVLVLEGCPHAESALEMAGAVAERFAGAVLLDRVVVSTEAQAAEIGFVGSPSVRVNGEDIEGRAALQGAMCYRIYEGSAGVPPKWMVEAAVLKATKPCGLLFLCVANSARSQIAEGVARSMVPEGVAIWSAGSRPTQIRSEAIAVLEEIGIDVSSYRSKAVSKIPADQIDTVITLCGEQECPLFLGKATRLHWGLPDPAAVQGDDKTRLKAFRQIREELRRRLSFVFDK